MNDAVKRAVLLSHGWEAVATSHGEHWRREGLIGWVSLESAWGQHRAETAIKGEVRVQLASEAAVRLMARLRNAEAGTNLHGVTWNTTKLVEALRAFYKDMGEMSDDKEQVYGTVVMGTSPLRKEAREATQALRKIGPYSVDEYADAASGVWEPVVERLLGIVADAYADVDGWKQRASDVVLDETLNPVVAVYDTEKHEFVDDQDG